MEDSRKLYMLHAPVSTAVLPESEALRLRLADAELCMVFASWELLEPVQDTYSESAYDVLRERLIRLISLGIEPVLCLYHGEMPGWFRLRGGWKKEDNLRHYLRYVGKTVRSVGHLVSRYITVAEPERLCRSGKVTLSAPLDAMASLSNMIGGHVRAYRLIHDTRTQRGLKDTSVGFLLHMTPASPLRRRFLGELDLLEAELLTAMARGRFAPPLINPLRIKAGEWCDFVAVRVEEEGEAAEKLRQEAEILTEKDAILTTF